MNNEIEQIAQQSDMSVEFVTWFFNEKKSACGEHWFLVLGAMWEGWKAREGEATALVLTLEKSREASGCPAGVDLQDWVKQVVAENAVLKSKGREVLNEACKVYEKLNATISSDSGDFIDGQTLHEFQFVLDVETPATDAYLAEVRAQAIRDALNASSDYLDTDCVMDRLDISYEEAEKRTSGAIEFHDAMVNFANQLREGADK